MKGTLTGADKHALPITQVISNAAVMMEHISNEIYALEHKVLAHAATGHWASPDRTQALQKFDLLHQTSVEMSHLLNRIAQVTDLRGTVDPVSVVGPIKLASMRAMIAENSPEGGSGIRETAERSIVLF